MFLLKTSKQYFKMLIPNNAMCVDNFNLFSTFLLSIFSFKKNVKLLALKNSCICTNLMRILYESINVIYLEFWVSFKELKNSLILFFSTEIFRNC